MFKDIIDNIKKWNIKRKSENVLCPHCSHNFHKVIKRIGIYPIYSCSQCHALFNYDGKKLKTPIFVENAPEDFTVIYREKDIKKTPMPKLTKEQEQIIKDFIEKENKAIATRDESKTLTGNAENESGKKYLVERDDHGVYDLWDKPCGFGEPEISFVFPEQLVSKIKKYIDKYDKIQDFLRGLIRIGSWEKEYYEKEQIEEYIIKFNKMFGSE